MHLFFVLFWQGRNKYSTLLILDRCCEQWGTTTGQLPEDGDSDCVWPPSGDVKECVCVCLDLLCEYIIGVVSGFEL